MIVITSFKPSSDRHLPQLPSSVRHQLSSPVGRLVCGLVFGLRARPSVGAGDEHDSFRDALDARDLDPAHEGELRAFF